MIPALDTATFAEVLLAVRDRLILRVDGSSEAACWICLNPEENPPAHPGDFGLAVAPYGGSFDAALFDGGGGHQLALNAGFSVVVWTNVSLDEPRRETEFLTNISLGVLNTVNQVLAAMAGDNLNGWRPARKDDYLTRDCVLPAGISFLRTADNAGRIGGVKIEFRVVFDWRLEKAGA